jgi:hypothetical protein
VGLGQLSKITVGVFAACSLLNLSLTAVILVILTVPNLHLTKSRGIGLLQSDAVTGLPAPESLVMESVRSAPEEAMGTADEGKWISGEENTTEVRDDSSVKK